ncbi:MAG: AraC family transcriptional regulator [Phycisphaerales bacterium]|nr:AraC family transcriptional regulator [Phycisphaerales bacterium]MCB9857644.1 AraC family transcriptional regulator [Phycisphaerales bacterium]MCB9864799.1 AraC family transcriptional regulator [Phycisphaerales bacterium]
MEYNEIEPIPPLAAYIHCLWTLRAPAIGADGAPDRVLPDGLAEIIINRAAPFDEIRDDGSVIRQPTAIIAAQMTRHLLIQPTSDVDLVGIRFRPAGLHAMLGIDQRELIDQRIELSCVESRISRALVEAAAADDDALGRTQAALMAMFERSKHRARVDIAHAAGWIRKYRGGCRIDVLASRLAITSRQLERRFVTEVGVTPKHYARIARFDALVRSAQAGLSGNWTTLAHAHGYHDQSHLNREFRTFAGQTPTEYARSENLIASLFTSGAEMSLFYKSSDIATA